MRWTKAGAHQLLQVRILVLNEELRTTFGRWYPGMKVEEVKEEQKASDLIVIADQSWPPEKNALVYHECQISS